MIFTEDARYEWITKLEEQFGNHIGVSVEISQNGDTAQWLEEKIDSGSAIHFAISDVKWALIDDYNYGGREDFFKSYTDIIAEPDEEIFALAEHYADEPPWGG